MNPPREYKNFVEAIPQTPDRGYTDTQRGIGGFAWSVTFSILILGLFSVGAAGLAASRFGWDNKTFLFAFLMAWGVLSIAALALLIDIFFQR